MLCFPMSGNHIHFREVGSVVNMSLRVSRFVL
uniref:Uncharacterized protein n=1 Tax=Anguilla anguilla TaxID=7936 RepID=A0A0E9XWF2_ANGAN